MGFKGSLVRIPVSPIICLYEFPITMKISFRHQRRARRVTLRLRPDGNITVTMPFGYHPEEVLPWVEKTLTKLPERASIPAPKMAELTAATGLVLPWLDGQLRIITVFDEQRQRVHLDYHPPKLHIHLPLKATILLWQEQMRKFTKKEARRLLTAKADAFCLALDLSYVRLRLADTVSRWGSCSSKRTLSFNFRLIRAPEFVVSAIVWHEVCHLRYAHHGPDFYALLREVCPRHDEASAWLRAHGQQLWSLF
jgi:predicted metal-dependent hydrolase